MAIEREKLVKNAEKFVSRGRIEAAIREYRKILEEQPRDVGTLNRVGDLYARINRVDEAARFFSQIAEQYSEEGFFVKAIAIYKKIIKLDPTRLEVYEQLAELYHKQGLVTEARTQYQVLADYYQKHENSASAISILLRMAELEPDDPSHRVKLAEIYHQQKLTEKAQEQYRQIAGVMLKHGRVDQAVQVLERGLEIDPEDLDFLAAAVDKLRASSDPGAARRLLVAASARNPAAQALLDQEPEAPGQAAAPPRLAPAAPPELEEAPTGPPSDFEEWPRVEETEPPEPISFDVDEAEPVAPPRPRPSGPGLLGADSDLLAALAEAEAAVGGEGEIDVGDGGSDDFLLGWDEEESESLIQPPADMLAKGPSVAGSGFRQAKDDGGGVGEATASWEIDLGSLDLGESLEVESAAPEGEEAESAEVDLSFDDLDFATVTNSGGAQLAEPEATYEADEAELAIDLGDELEDFADIEVDASAQAPPGFEAAAHLSPEDLLSEAEVLAKYSLREKAFDRVGEVLRGNPDHPAAHRVLIQLHLEQGDLAEVRQLADRLKALLAGNESHEEWQRVEGLFAAAGFSYGEKAKSKPPGVRVGAHPPSPPPATTPMPPPQSVAEPPPMAPGVTLPPRRPPSSDRIDRLLESLLGETQKPPARPPTAPKRKASEAEELFAGMARDLARTRPASGAPAESPAQPPPLQPPPVQPPPVAPPAAASQAPVSRPVREPSSPPISLSAIDLEDHSDIDDALAGMGALGGMGSLGSAASPAKGVAKSVADRLDDTGTSWLDEVEAKRRTEPADENLFAEEEGFFDLAAELESELTVSDAMGTQQGGEQSLEEIVQGFKRGVEEQLSKEDFNTHFDLGIAYREMGLLDEAIGEFQLAAKAPKLLASCCSMLGICFLEKGLPELAIKWYTRGLASPELSEEDSLALMYDLGDVYLAKGDYENARKTFVEVYGTNSHFRDISARLAQLADV